ncbi:S-DNA-T family DNA segregation ATPase FtsK/SpoIIIE [Xanthobacter tagetidis]|nr:S-DNA-T family DNA segregation ATPase FtsK/SpoIIIE [Xanthobacter tagetidis]
MARRPAADAVMHSRLEGRADPLHVPHLGLVPDGLKQAVRRRSREIIGAGLLAAGMLAMVALVTWSASDPSLSNATGGTVKNLLGRPGAVVADMLMQLFGLACIAIVAPLLVWGWGMLTHRPFSRARLRLAAWTLGVIGVCAFLSAMPRLGAWPTPAGLGGVIGDLFPRAAAVLRGGWGDPMDGILIAAAGLALALGGLFFALSGGRRTPLGVNGAHEDDEDADDGTSISLGAITHTFLSLKARLFPGRRLPRIAMGGVGAFAKEMFASERPAADTRSRMEPSLAGRRAAPAPQGDADDDGDYDAPPPRSGVPEFDPPRPAQARPAERRPAGPPPRDPPKGRRGGGYQHPALDLLAAPPPAKAPAMSPEALKETANLLEGTLQDFGVRGEIGQVRPGPVVTLYELEPAPGIKSSRVIGLADDIARSMSAISARVAVVPGRNAIGIELPNSKREKVLLRELLATRDFGDSGHKLAIALGKTIGGEPVIVDLARMPHLLVAGTTGSGKSVAINTMILSLLYRLKPEQCRLIMVDPKMLELSVYDGIPHLLAPVVTDPKKAVVALKWAVKEMEDRYKKMSKLGVRNIDGFNARVRESLEKGETVSRTVQTGFDHETGEAIYESEEMDLKPLPYIVVIVDEMADLMLVAGKDIEGAIQRLAQMARAAGIHLVMATQRPSVDVITGTIKANFPTRISFQVTSKIDSRTILGEMGAEQLLGQGDMLYMAGGGRISRVHGPFVADEEVETVVRHLKAQGVPDYVEAVTADMDEENGDEDGAVFDKGSFGEEGQDLYSQAVQVVLRDKKCSTSYIQRRLQIGYNRAASLVERMEKEGVVGAPNHAGKREILLSDEAAE